MGNNMSWFIWLYVSIFLGLYLFSIGIMIREIWFESRPLTPEQAADIRNNMHISSLADWQ